MGPQRRFQVRERSVSDPDKLRPEQIFVFVSRPRHDHAIGGADRRMGNIQNGSIFAR